MSAIYFFQIFVLIAENGNKISKTWSYCVVVVFKRHLLTMLTMISRILFRTSTEVSTYQLYTCSIVLTRWTRTIILVWNNLVKNQINVKFFKNWFGNSINNSSFNIIKYSIKIDLKYFFEKLWYIYETFHMGGL